MKVSLIPSAERRAAAKSRRAERKAAKAQREALHRARLAAAAAVSTVVLRCHTDLWQQVQGMAKDRIYVSLPGPSAITALGKDLMEVRLSGPTLASVMRLLHEFSGSIQPDTAATARQLYQSLAAAVDQVDPAAPPRTLPPILMDGSAQAAH